MEKRVLKRVRQCVKCPWKKSTNPHDIPNGYCEAKHRRLRNTIAVPGEIRLSGGVAMACHESPVGDESFCVGWLMNQLGPGNNIGLRIKMLKYDLSGIELDGDQHETFEDTLP